MNTTGNVFTYTDINNKAITVAAGFYVRVHADGSLVLAGDGGSTGLFLNGAFDLEVGTPGLSVAATANLEIKVAGTDVLNLGATGALLINANGIAAYINLSLNAGAITGGTGFTLSGSFTLAVNTTSSPITQIGGITVNLVPRAPTPRSPSAGRSSSRSAAMPPASSSTARST